MTPSSSLHIVTPLIRSDRPTDLMGGVPVFLKLENLQPSGSFKIRGIGHTCSEAKANGAVKIVGSSGGNAGMAMAYAARKLGMEAELYIPTSTPKFMVDKIREEGAKVVVGGSNWNEANEGATRCLQNDPKASFVHPYAQETTWQGHSSIVDEVKAQLEACHEVDDKPLALVTVVGGGGLAAGILIGMERSGWSGNVPLLTMETEGADCFNAAIQKKEIVKLEAINSVATSLGALSVLPRLFEMQQSKDHWIESGLVTDTQAIEATLKFANHHRMLVEPACGAALAAVYSKDVSTNPLNSLVEERLKQTDSEDRTRRPIVVIVCGGNITSLDSMAKYKLNLESGVS